MTESCQMIWLRNILNWYGLVLLIMLRWNWKCVYAHTNTHRSQTVQPACKRWMKSAVDLWSSHGESQFGRDRWEIILVLCVTYVGSPVYYRCAPWLFITMVNYNCCLLLCKKQHYIEINLMFSSFFSSNQTQLKGFCKCSSI